MTSLGVELEWERVVLEYVAGCEVVDTGLGVIVVDAEYLGAVVEEPAYDEVVGKAENFDPCRGGEMEEEETTEEEEMEEENFGKEAGPGRGEGGGGGGAVA